MCGRYRLTKRRMLEIEQYYDIDDVTDLEIWKKEYNIPPREMAPCRIKSEVEEDAHLRRLLRLEPTFRDCLVSARLDR
jgi:putative SOS response-associated peptidase YedK